MTRREEMLAERAELIAKNEAATSWGAAVGARSERIKEIDRALAAQSDFEQRIRSALTATVGTAEPGYVAGFEACRAAAVKITKPWPGFPTQDSSEFKLSDVEKAVVDIRQKLADAIAALPAPATASAGWQPIDNAPKDGTYVLVYRPILGTRAACVEHFEKGFWVAGSCMWPGEPTHWMPLPAAPTKRSAT